MKFDFIFKLGSPDAYYVIQNDDHVKVAYLLVYCKYGNLNSDTSRYYLN